MFLSFNFLSVSSILLLTACSSSRLQGEFFPLVRSYFSFFPSFLSASKYRPYFYVGLGALGLVFLGDVVSSLITWKRLKLAESFRVHSSRFPKTMCACLVLCAFRGISSLLILDSHLFVGSKKDTAGAHALNATLPSHLRTCLYCGQIFCAHFASVLFQEQVFAGMPWFS